MLSKVIGALFACAMAGGVFAASPSEIFAAHRDAVLDGSCLAADSCRFGIGTAVQRNPSAAGQAAAMEKAKLQATANLVCRKVAEGIVWPEAVEPEIRTVLAAYVANSVSAKATIRGAEVVYTHRDPDGKCLAVVAAPEKELSAVKSATFADARRILLEGRWLKRHMSGPYAKELYAFYLTQKKLPESLMGTNFVDWDEAQVNLFCGLPPPPPPPPEVTSATVTNEVASSVEQTALVEQEIEEEEIHPEFILPPYATANENETIGF